MTKAPQKNVPNVGGHHAYMSLFMRKGTSWHEITFSGNAWQKKLCHS